MARPIVTTVLIQDVLYEASPELNDAHPAFTNALVCLLRPALNRVVRAHRTPTRLTEVIARQRARVAVCSTTAAAFELFVSNMADA
ncbi:conserved hypothetical protein [Cupriavidus necator]|uniref:Uncharacterized protein n=1 Tax=Cupriavidus necator TaxID=106590 RepID=A0A1K0JYE6_CUPNE|nr:conserved hypothetical protein [Cupriavidus necator]